MVVHVLLGTDYQMVLFRMIIFSYALHVSFTKKEIFGPKQVYVLIVVSQDNIEGISKL